MAIITFSTADYAKQERLEAAQDIYAAMSNIHLSLPRGQTPDIQTRIRLLPGISLAITECSPLTVKRGALQLQDGNDDYALLLNLSKKGVVLSQVGGIGERPFSPGTACVGFNDRPGLISFQTPKTSLINLSFSRSLLAPLVKDLERKSKAPIYSQESFPHLVQCVIDLLQAPNTESNLLDETNRLLDLTALLIGAPRDVEITARQRGLKEARRRAVKSDLKINAWRGDTSLTAVAKRHGVSPGYIRAMFEQEGESFTDYLVALRLDRVFQCLTSPAHSHKKVADILYDAGFNNPSWFYRAFKRRFGMTPSEARDPALQRHPE